MFGIERSHVTVHANDDKIIMLFLDIVARILMYFLRLLQFVESIKNFFHIPYESLLKTLESLRTITKLTTYSVSPMKYVGEMEYATLF